MHRIQVPATVCNNRFAFQPGLETFTAPVFARFVLQQVATTVHRHLVFRGQRAADLQFCRAVKRSRFIARPAAAERAMPECGASQLGESRDQTKS